MFKKAINCLEPLKTFTNDCRCYCEYFKVLLIVHLLFCRNLQPEISTNDAEDIDKSFWKTFQKFAGEVSIIFICGWFKRRTMVAFPRPK